MGEGVVLRPGRSSKKPVIRPVKKATPTRPPSESLDSWFKKLLVRTMKTRPGFAEAWVGESSREGFERIAKYNISTASVNIYAIPGSTEVLYQLGPREYAMPEAETRLVYQAKQELARRVPDDLLSSNPQTMKERGRKVAREILSELMRSMSVDAVRLDRLGGLDFLTEVLLRHSIGYGVLEYLLEDAHIQDIYIDAPADENPVHVIIGDVGDERANGKCLTNIILSEREVKSLVSRLRYESGRPFSESMPVLETDIHEYDTRVTVIGRPLSPEGIAIALRRHSVEPWTLPKLIGRGSISPLAAGLLSFLIDGRSTILVAGSRGAGKSSLLGAMMLEFPLNQRILTIEDTLELPTAKMQELGYKVQSLFVQSAIGGTGDRTADDALRVSLRLGESAIVLGEVRGREARTLYEAMRSGSAGSAVLGTIHGNSARSVFERIVYDLDIHAEAFSATDIVVVCGLVRPGGRQRQVRRVTNISELVKDAEPGTFRDLLVYDETSDTLVETEDFQTSSRLERISQDWGISLDEAISNIRARARMREMMVELATQQNPKLLSPSAVVKMNNKYWSLVDEFGTGESARLLEEWSSWAQRGATYV